MAFSKRIKRIASLIDRGVNVIDIGCDHALLDIYLTIYNENKCLASDINKKAIEIAKKNIKKYCVDIETHISNGFDKIEILENTTCVIAGMGTNTIIEILKNDQAKEIETYIIQTNNDHYSLRKFMTQNGYYIEDELTFLDKKIRYIIIKFKKGRKKYSDLELELGPILIQKKNPEIIQYFSELYEQNNKILKKMPNKYIFRIIEIKKKNKIIKKLLKSK